MNSIGHHGNVVQFLFDGLLAGIVQRERGGGGREKVMFLNIYLLYVVERQKAPVLCKVGGHTYKPGFVCGQAM